MFKWIKSYMPKRLFGRAALILLLPVVSLQLIVSVLFVQRHFADMTGELTFAVAAEIDGLFLVKEDQAAFEKTINILNFSVQKLAVQAEFDESRRLFDFTGILIAHELKQNLDGYRGVNLPDIRKAQIYVERDGTLYCIEVPRKRLSPTNAHQLFVNMFVFGALMTLIAYFYLRNQLRPITRLADAASAFGRGQVIPYHVSGAAEVREAGSAFLGMRARIERHIEQRTLILSGISHDLRTPLTRLKLGLALLEDEDRIPLEKDVEEMRALLDEFLNFVRQGTLDIAPPQPINPVDLAGRLIAEAEKQGHPVSFGTLEPEDGRLVDLREVPVARALTNLIQNGVKYGGTVRVSIRIGPNFVRFRVEDDGPGIPEEMREEVLKPFTRLDPARNQNRGSGVGLGLAITADIARAQGGSLRLDQSEDMGGLMVDLLISTKRDEDVG